MTLPRVFLDVSADGSQLGRIVVEVSFQQNIVNVIPAGVLTTGHAISRSVSFMHSYTLTITCTVLNNAILFM